jgi:hypothetical protein
MTAKCSINLTLTDEKVNRTDRVAVIVANHDFREYDERFKGGDDLTLKQKIILTIIFR